MTAVLTSDYVDPHDINSQDNDGQTTLSHAAEAGDEEMVEMLLMDNGTDVDLRDLKGRTALLLAAKKGHSNVVAQLLRKGANPNLEDLSGATPLWQAAHKGHTSIVRLLLGCGRMVNWNAKKLHIDVSCGATALSIALMEHHHDAAVMLSRMDGINPFVLCDSSDALELAIEYKSEDVAFILLGRFGTGQRGSELLATAIRSGNTRLVEALLMDHGVNPNKPNKYGHRPLELAVQRDQAAAARLLLAHEKIQPCMADLLSWINFPQTSELVRLLVADGRFDMNYVNNKGQTLLSEMARWGQTAFVEELLRDNRIDPDRPDDEGRTPLSFAVEGYRGNVRVVQQLLSTGRVDPNSVDKNGMTPLCHAASGRDVDMIKVLLEHPDIDPNGRGQFVPLNLALSHFTGEEVEVLLSHPGTDPNRADAHGNTALAIATRKGYIVLVERLLAIPRANIGYRDSTGWSLYHEAARQRPHISAERLMKLLLGTTNGDDPDMADSEGRTPLSVAAEYGQIGVVNMLLAVDGVRPDAKDAVGRGPLSWAIASTAGGSDVIDQRLKVVRRLLEIEDVNPNARDADGMAPLMHAALRHGCSGSMVQLLVLRDDLDVHQTNQNGCTAMTVAKAYGDTMSMSLLRAWGAVDDKTVFGILAGHGATGVTNITRKSSDVGNEHHHDPLEWDDYRDGKDSLLPLGKQDAYQEMENGDVNLCPRCETMDLDNLFSKAQSSVDLGQVDASWQSRPCAMCRLIAAVRPGHRDGRAADDSQPCVLKAFGTTWFGTLRSDWSENWIDTKVLGVVHQRDSEYYADVGFDQHIPIWMQSRPHIFEAATIGRLGSNCPYGIQALTVSQQAASPFIDIDVAKSWINHCREHHTSESCTRQQFYMIPHFRLIECATGHVITLDQGGNGSPPAIPPYAALSYVWGQGNQGNQKIRAQQIVQDERHALPAVIHDAISMTLRLGYEYLWVDQYCVVQEGDGAVKREQLRTMDLVYANAEVTLVAAAGKDASAGLPGAPDRPRTGGLCVRIQGHKLTVVPPYPAHHIRLSSTWWTRGWTYQEGLMAHRRLFFSGNEMSFECGAHYTRREAVQHPLHTNYDNSLTHLRPHVFHSEWRLFSILEEYTARRLTYPVDALNAMLGIFRAYAQRKNAPLHHLCGVPVVLVGVQANGSDDDGHGDIGIDRSDAGASEGEKDGGDNHPMSRWDGHPFDTVSIATTKWPCNSYSELNWDLWKDLQQAANNRVGTVAGFVHGLFWRLKRPAHRRPGFPSWSWTGWTGTVEPRKERDLRWHENFERVFIVPADISISVVIPAHSQSGTPAVTATVPWGDFYNGLVDGTDEKYLSQNYVLAITAPVVSVRFREKSTRHDAAYYPNPAVFIASVLLGNSIWQGDFYPTREDAYSQESNPGTASSFRERLLSEPWLGIMLRLAPRQDQRVVATVLVVEDVQSTAETDRCWERIGISRINLTLEGHALERRTIYLS